MTDAERLAVLEGLQHAFQGEVLRAETPERGALLQELWTALSFNTNYSLGAQKAAELFLSKNASPSDHESAVTELNMILGQAINELKHALAPLPSAVARGEM